MRDKWDELRKLHHPAPRWAERCYADGESWPCLTSQLLDENAALRAALKGVEGVPRIRRNDYDAAWKAFDKALGDAS